MRDRSFNSRCVFFPLLKQVKWLLSSLNDYLDVTSLFLYKCTLGYRTAKTSQTEWWGRAVYSGEQYSRDISGYVKTCGRVLCPLDILSSSCGRLGRWLLNDFFQDPLKPSSLGCWEMLSCQHFWLTSSRCSLLPPDSQITDESAVSGFYSLQTARILMSTEFVVSCVSCLSGLDLNVQ